MMFELPSPEQKLDWPLFEERQIDVWIKRDDLIHPAISGNKWRKLQPIIAMAEEKGISALHSYGGAWSNHLLALAACSAHFAYASKGYVRGEPVNNPVLDLCRDYGMELEFMSRDEFRERRQSQNQLIIEDDILIIPEGANCIEGRKGMKSVWDELQQDYSIVLDSVGSGTSVRGLYQAKPANTEVWGMMAVKDHALADSLEMEGIKVLRNYARRGFAKMDEELIAACKEFDSKTGIQLDPVYTGKQWMALLDLVETGEIKPGEKVLFMHSGGLAGWLSNPA